MVADVAPNSGDEIIISDGEVRILRCIDSTGKQIWEFDGNWLMHLTSVAAISFNVNLDFPVLAIGNPDGKLCCLNASTSEELWTKNIIKIEWGSPVWADLDGDGQDELIAATEFDGITAFNADGAVLWTYREDADGNPVVVGCPITAKDVDGDGKSEVFAVDRWGPLSLSHDGELLWHQRSGNEFISGVEVTDIDGDGKYDVFCASQDDNLVYRIDAENGNIIWNVPMLSKCDVYPNSYYPTGDLNKDGKSEVIVCDKDGNVYCINSSGKKLWTFTTPKPIHASAALADIDGDGNLDVIITSGDHFVYVLGAEGDLKGKYEEDRRLMAPATIADVNKNGRKDILFGGSGRKLNSISVSDKMTSEETEFLSEIEGSNKNKAKEIFSLFNKGGFELAKNPDFPFEQVIFGSAGIV